MPSEHAACLLEFCTIFAAASSESSSSSSPAEQHLQTVAFRFSFPEKKNLKTTRLSLSLSRVLRFHKVSDVDDRPCPELALIKCAKVPRPVSVLEQIQRIYIQPGRRSETRDSRARVTWSEPARRGREKSVA